MCGFVGFVEEKDENTEKIVRKMADQIVHRGPDQDDYFVGDMAALGFRRLSIIDLDTGNQPISLSSSGSEILTLASASPPFSKMATNNPTALTPLCDNSNIMGAWNMI